MKQVNKRPEFKEKLRQYMLNGGAVRAIKGIKNPSKEELKLRGEFEKVNQELNLEYEYQHKVSNYVLDIAIFPYKIAIEYDGWYHFDCQHNIDYHKKRQGEIEKEGWKFIRYSIFQKFPKREQIKEDINNILKICTTEK